MDFSPTQISYDKESFLEAKQVFLRKMEGRRGVSPNHKRIKIEPRADQVIRELQQEEDNMSMQSKREINQTVGVSVNAKLNGEDIDCDG